MEAQRAGVSYGPHEGKLVPEGSALVEARGIVKDKTITVRYSGEKEGVSQSVLSGLEKEKYRIPITVEGKTTFLTKQQAEKLDELSGKAQFEYLKDIGAIKKDRVYIPGKGGDWSFLPASEVKEIRKDKDLYNALLTGGVEAYEKAFSEKHIVIGDKALPISEWNELSEGYQSIAVKRNSFDAMAEQIDADLNAMKQYKDDKGEYKLAEAVNAGVDIAIIQRLFGDKAAWEAKRDARSVKSYEDYMAAPPQEKFDILVSGGKISKGSKYDSLDKEGAELLLQQVLRGKPTLLNVRDVQRLPCSEEWSLLSSKLGLAWWPHLRLVDSESYDTIPDIPIFKKENECLRDAFLFSGVDQVTIGMPQHIGGGKSLARRVVVGGPKTQVLNIDDDEWTSIRGGEACCMAVATHSVIPAFNLRVLAISGAAFHDPYEDLGGAAHHGISRNVAFAINAINWLLQ